LRAARLLGVGVLALLLLTLPQTTFAFHYPWDQGHYTFSPNDDPRKRDPGPHRCNEKGSPLIVATGNFTTVFADLVFPSSHEALTITRTYNTQDGRVGLLGRGWQLSFESAVLDVTDGRARTAICRQGDGSRDRYQLDMNGRLVGSPDVLNHLEVIPTGGWKLTRGDGAQVLFNRDGLPQTFSDAVGNEATATYDNTRFLQSIMDAHGQGFTTTRNPNGRLASLTDRAGRTLSFEYDSHGNLAKSIDPDGASTTYEYDSNDLLLRIRDGQTRIIQDLQYDALGRVTRFLDGGVPWTVTYRPDQMWTEKTNPLGEAWRFFYNAHGNITRITTPIGTKELEYNGDLITTRVSDVDGKETVYTYSASGSMLSISENGHLRKSFEYDASDRLQSESDAIGARTRYAYDSHGHLQQIINRSGHQLSISNSTDGRPLSAVDPNGTTLLLTYDAEGRLASQSLDGHVSQYVYDPVGNVSHAVQPSGRAVDFIYDSYGTISGIVDASGNRVSRDIDATGSVRFSARLQNGQTTFHRDIAYDAFGRVVSIDQGGAGQTAFTYDAAGNLTRVVDPVGSSTSIEYGPQGRVARIVDPAGFSRTFDRDAAGRITRQTDAGGLTLQQTYDPDGNLLSLIDPDRGTVRYEYDLARRVTARTDGRGVRADLGYDVLGRPIRIGYMGSPDSVRLEYDGSSPGSFGVGTMTKASYAAGETNYMYDRLGKMIGTTQTVHGQLYQIDYTYDLDGNIAEITYPSRTRVAYSRDAVGRTSAITVTPPGGSPIPLILNIDHLPYGPPTHIDYGNGVQLLKLYDLGSRLVELDAGSLLHFRYTYSADGNLTSITNVLTPSESEDLQYDPVDRLTVANGAYGALRYGYTPNGDRLTSTLNGSTANYSYEPGTHRLTQVIGTAVDSYTYDLAGNAVQVRGSQLEYGSDGRLRSLSFGPTRTNYAYDHLGLRISKQNADGETHYVYDNSTHLLAEQHTGTVNGRDYIYADDNLVGIVDYLQGQAPQLRSVITDHAGRPIVLIDRTGVPVWRARYGPFGDLASIHGTATLNLRAPGQYFDSESGLTYNQQRYYDATLGRYIQADPLETALGLSSYSYALSNPNRWADPTGANPAAVAVLIAACLESPPCAAALIYAAYLAQKALSEFIQRLIDGTIPLPAIPWPRTKTDTGDCTPDQHRSLQDAVDAFCKRERSCNGLQSCSELFSNLAKSQQCLAARQTINNTCFGGGDAGHKQAVEEAGNSIDKCYYFLQKKRCLQCLAP
jgi:RHS repeat-associated protein